MADELKPQDIDPETLRKVEEAVSFWLSENWSLRKLALELQSIFCDDEEAE